MRGYKRRYAVLHLRLPSVMYAQYTPVGQAACASPTSLLTPHTYGIFTFNRQKKAPLVCFKGSFHVVTDEKSYLTLMYSIAALGIGLLGSEYLTVGMCSFFNKSAIFLQP